MKSLIAMFILLVFSNTVTAGTIYVPADLPTIQAAIDAAAAKDQILVAPGIYHENLDFMGKEIILRSTDGAENTTIEAPCPRPVLTIFNVAGDSALLEGFRITGGAGQVGAGIRMENSVITIRSNIIENNIATGDTLTGKNAMGGGIYSLNCPATFDSNVIQNNQAIVPDVEQTQETHGASAFGGGLYIEPGNCRIYNCSILSNTASGGSVQTTTEINRSASAYGGNSYGGGICIIDRIFQVTDHITNCDIRFNQSNGGNAGSWYRSKSHGGNAWGAGIYFEEIWDTALIDCIFEENTSSGGIAECIHANDGSATGGSIFGGALSVAFSEHQLYLQRCLFDKNAGSGGKSILYYLPGTTPVSDIDGISFGGAFYSGQSASLKIENSVFRANSLTDHNEDSMGSAFFADSTADCIFSTIIYSSGASAINGSTLHNLISCIVYFNEDGTGMFNAEFSDIEDGCPGTGNFDSDPLFKDSTDFHLSLTSPCIDTGKTHSLDNDYDQDSRPAFLGHDIGADEFTGNLPTATPTETPVPAPETYDNDTNTGKPEIGGNPIATATPSEPFVSIMLPRHYVVECDMFRVDINMWNPGPVQPGVNLVVALEYQESFWFLPSWSLFDPATGNGFDFYLLDEGFLPGLNTKNVVAPFEWPPEDSHNFTEAIFYAALLTPDMSEIIGNLDIESWTFNY